MRIYSVKENRGFLTDFAKGIIAGFIAAVIITSIIFGFVIAHNQNREGSEYAERQIEIEELQEHYSGLDIDEFLEIPDIRRAVDGAAAEFDRKRDEALERFRGGLSSGAGLVDK